MKRYGMRLRPAGPGCQPSGFIRIEESSRYYNVIVYDRELTEKEIEEYSLDDLEKIEKKQIEIMRISRDLKENKVATTDDIDIAEEYAENNNEYHTYSVEQIGPETYEIRLEE